MTVTSDQVIANVEIYIPDSNGLTDEQMHTIATQLILEIGDDDANLPKISCEFLKRIADINDTLFSVDDAGLKSEKLGRRTLTWDTTMVADGWADYKTKVNNVICPILGVTNETKRRVAGVFISSGEKICVNETLYP